MDELLPALRSFQSYDGSLTTSPCTQGVRWIVLDAAIDNVSVEQYRQFRHAMYRHNTNRPPQPRNERD